jgi:hypothetical protein
VVVGGKIIASEHYRDEDSLNTRRSVSVLRLRTLFPSLDEILLELEGSDIFILLQAKHREILSPP